MNLGPVYIVDDDPAVRDSLRMLLTMEGLSVRTFPSAPAFLDSLAPDAEGCVISDIRMPEVSGLDMLEMMRTRNLRLPVIVITAHGDIPLAVEAMKRGAIDFLEKPFDDEALIASIRRGLSDGAAAQMRHAEEQEAAVRLNSLTKREREILDGLADGHSNKVIAHKLGISVRTAEVHRANMMTKMRARNLADLIRMVLANPRSGSMQ